MIFWNDDILRFANIFELNRVDVDNIQSAVKKVKTRTNVYKDSECDTYNILLSADNIFSSATRLAKF